MTLVDTKPITDALFTPKQLGERLARTERTLWVWRKEGYGPPYVKQRGRVYYRAEDVNEWLSGVGLA